MATLFGIISMARILLTILNSGLVLTNPLPRPPPALVPRFTSPCPAVRIISARGTSEDPGEGRLATVASDIAKGHENSERVPLDYPAELFPYSLSLHQGIRALKSLLNTTVSECPDSKIVVMGYSQGAHVIGNTLCGGTITKAIDTVIGDKVTAIIFMADPRHVPGKPYDVGTATRGGLFARPDSESCDYFAPRLRAYCDSDDLVCDRGFDREVHRAVVGKYQADAVAFVNGLLN
ncbi:uncharacterized protein PADG_04617 [Paracoccidioides brasiliensis Pb18]|uniref:Cutinase n=2 Tax=Paracoccidioides brasiliensis TaxID=121759 RepID=C1GC95_PARBD|nr:uncharacterized protein PADG_04617 [Paracoccidioides brasiliensis Pb18]EEH48538.1 hypothetical protein PADG_04617 [Paracoccidioides brasiliensis Pb18]ODH27123.1 hypothetical protein ACO22_04288 [Paracoccidioides brasiliensis]ODH47262.1 hypothetical protein GX48_06664 [Paracoccidioides brasiliensis]